MKEALFGVFKFFCEKLYGKGLWRFPFLRNTYFFLFKKLGPQGKITVEYKGIKLFAHSNDIGVTQGFLVRGGYENLEAELFEKALKKGMTVLDLGANIGLYSLIAASKIGKTGRVYAFEPEPGNYSLLNENIKYNNYENIILPFNNAVSNKDGETLKLFLDKDNLSCPSFSVENIPDYSRTKSVNVKTVTLDKFLKSTILKDGRKSVDIIKIDVQGAEDLTFSGAQNLLKNAKELTIFMEYWPFGIRNLKGNPEKMLEMFDKLGFKFYIVDEFEKKLTKNTLKEVLKKAEDKWNINIVMKK